MNYALGMWKNAQNQRIIVWINMNTGAQYRGIPTGGHLEYQYNVDTQILTIYVRDRNGNYYGFDANGNAYPLPTGSQPVPAFQGKPRDSEHWAAAAELFNNNP